MIWVLVACAAAWAITFCALAWTYVDLRRTRSVVAQLRSGGDSAGLRDGRAFSMATDAMRAVVSTAVRVQQEGVGAFLMKSIEEFTGIVLADRKVISEIAGPDGTLTILFSDIEGSTAINERLGDAAWVHLLTEHDAIVRSQVTRYRGHVVKHQGDGFMIVFPDPASAVRAAIGIQSAEHGAVGLDRSGAFKVRIGIHEGTAIERDGDYFGRNVALAARVAALANGGEVLVTKAVRLALGEAFGFEDLGDTILKGFPETHQVFRVELGTCQRNYSHVAVETTCPV